MSFEEDRKGIRPILINCKSSEELSELLNILDEYQIAHSAAQFLQDGFNYFLVDLRHLKAALIRDEGTLEMLLDHHKVFCVKVFGELLKFMGEDHPTITIS